MDDATQAEIDRLKAEIDKWMAIAQKLEEVRVRVRALTEYPNMGASK